MKSFQRNESQTVARAVTYISQSDSEHGIVAHM